MLAYIETFRGVQRGERVWQLGFGSGFKCNSAVWRANRSLRSQHAAWQGFDVNHMVRLRLPLVPGAVVAPAMGSWWAACRNCEAFISGNCGRHP